MSIQVETRSYSDYTRFYDRHTWRFTERMTYAEWVRSWVEDDTESVDNSSS
jgi:hypothetical protein